MTSTTNSIRLRRALAGALMIAGFAGAAAASTTEADNHGNVRATPEQGQARAPSEQRYCVREASSETRLSRRVCRTRAEWQADGAIASPR